MEPAKADARQKITIDVAAAIFRMFFFFVEIRIKSQRPFRQLAICRYISRPFSFASPDCSGFAFDDFYYIEKQN